jgi:hypothetical protein
VPRPLENRIRIVHPAGTVFDEYVYALARHRVRVREIDREDPGGLGMQELPPRRPDRRGAAPDLMPQRAGSPTR